MRAREMMKRLDRLPKRKGGVQKVPDLSLLSPEEQDRVDELFKVLLDSKDISSKTFDTAFAEFDNYCKSDVINTYRLWLRHELFRGRLDHKQFESSEENVIGFLSRAPVLG